MSESTDRMIRTYPHGVTSWVDVEQPDVDDAAAFYGGLFGWTFTQVTPDGAPSRYLVASVDGADVAGIGSAADTGPGWNTYIAVDDAAAAAEQVRAAGGVVVQGPAQAGEGGVAVTCLDPAGVPFRLWQAGNRPGAQRTNESGTWNFSDLQTPDPDGDVRFYVEVFGWEVTDNFFATMIKRPGYGDHLASTVDPTIHERQDAISAPAGFADAIAWLQPVPAGRSPQWHVTFAVDDRDAAADRAEELGGTVLERTDTDWTRAALVRDPQGAELTLSQFTPPE